MNNDIIEALAKCSKIHQLLGSGIPQQEEALIVLFSTGGFEKSSHRDIPIVSLIHRFADSGYSPIRLNRGSYNSPKRGEILFFQAQGLGAYQCLSQYLAGAYIMFDKSERLSRADSLVILPYDSKQQTPEECIEKYLESQPNVWSELRYMYMDDSFYESMDAQSHFDLPPELERALSQIQTQQHSDSKRSV